MDRRLKLTERYRLEEMREALVEVTLEMFGRKPVANLRHAVVIPWPSSPSER